MNHGGILANTTNIMHASNLKLRSYWRLTANDNHVKSVKSTIKASFLMLTLILQFAGASYDMYMHDDFSLLLEQKFVVISLHFSC
jgi:hypothetical protein